MAYQRPSRQDVITRSAMSWYRSLQPMRRTDVIRLVGRSQTKIVEYWVRGGR